MNFNLLPSLVSRVTEATSKYLGSFMEQKIQITSVTAWNNFSNNLAKARSKI